MAKNSYYFSHDYNSRNDPKMVKLQMKMGHEGKGIYWDLVEMLHEQDGYLMLSDIDGIAFELRTDSERIKKIISDFDLFQKDNVKFWSESALRRIELKNAKSLKAKQSAQARWEKKNANASKDECERIANEEQTQSERKDFECEGNALKEKKRKESKPNKKNYKLMLENLIQDYPNVFNLLKQVLPYFEKNIIENLSVKQKYDWLNTLKQLHTKHSYSVDYVKKVIVFGKTDSFWKTNFLSLATLNKKGDDGITKFEKIKAKYEASTETPTLNFEPQQDLDYSNLTDKYKAQ